MATKPGAAGNMATDRHQERGSGTRLAPCVTGLGRGTGNTEGVRCTGNDTAGNSSQAAVRGARWITGKGRQNTSCGRWIRIGDIGVNIWFLTEKEINIEYV